MRAQTPLDKGEEERVLDQACSCSAEHMVFAECVGAQMHGKWQAGCGRNHHLSRKLWDHRVLGPAGLL